ncbi:MAG: tRNA (adenosine(37)-N6)-dimethylallyltransferase MiaA [Bacteroidales bacterium]|jgi:tRNA dimethylallyltransferase|nr:tRNA (adenosine(37)-N6)-dimethylallyltransferase MiaA [Bacteroidales bacterium]
MEHAVKRKKLIVVLGPTASGKTATAIALARRYRTEIVSADSRQFYKELKIGTASPTIDELIAAPHHFIGHLSIYDYYNASRFESDAMEKLKDIFIKNDVAIMTGGSGLYIDAVINGIDELPDPTPELRRELKRLLETKGIGALQEKLLQYDPEYYQTVDLKNPKRLLRALEVSVTAGKPYSELRVKSTGKRFFEAVFVGLECERSILNDRICRRVDQMLDAGLAEEAMQFFHLRDLNALNTVGYKELYEWKDGKISFEQVVENIKTNTRRYAKRQMTWFRKNKAIKWFPHDQIDMIFHFCDQMLEGTLRE